MADIAISGVSKRFGTTLAVNDVELTIPEGTFATFLGPSGCGKTTTLRMVAGLERPDAGEIRIGGEIMFADNIFIPPEKRQIGMVFQSYAIWPHMTVLDNVAYPLKVRRVPKARMRESALKALETVRLADLATRYPAQLSGGQQQRVALARAIVFEPRLLLLDEPLSNLDAKLREHMRIELRELQQRLGLTTLYVTHDQQEALALSDLVMVMDRGRIVQSGTPREIYTQPSNRFVADFVGWANFLPGEVINGRTIRVLGFELQTDALSAGMETGANVDISIRPEDVRLVPSGSIRPLNVIDARVKTTLYMGNHEFCELSVGDQSILAHIDANETLVRDETVHVELNASRMLVLTR